MESAWAFLQPWRGALARCLRLEPNDDLERRGVLASFRCWSDVNNLPECIAVDRWFLRVEFPTLPSARNNRRQQQRVREAVELFDRLAAVDNAAFESLLSEFLIDRSDRRTGPPRRPRVVWPTWELQLSGTVSTGDAIESQSAVTWGQLFGCPDDPWETSSAFRAAMETLKALGLGTGGNEYNSIAFNGWQVFGDEMLMEGSQKLVKERGTFRSEPFSREMNKLFELRAPPMAHLIAVGEKATLMNMWKQPEQPENRGETSVKSEEAETWPGLLSQPELLGMVAAIARADMATLSLVLDEAAHSDGDADNVNMGFLLSTLVGGSSLCFAADRSFPALRRSGKFSAWDVEWSGTSGRQFGALLSAFAEATHTPTLTLTAAYEDDSFYGPVYWSWLAYAFWSRASRSSVQNLSVAWITLTEAHVAAVKKALASSFPEPAENQSTAPSAYGYVDTMKGHELRPAGRGDRNAAALNLAENCRCRAHYDPSSMNGVADVVVPGNGICELTLGATTTFVPDTFDGPMKEGGRDGIRSLSLALAGVENNRVVAQLLQLVGGGLQTLSLHFGCADDRRMSLSLSAVASACPKLKELQLHDWNVLLGDDLGALKTWGLKKLSIWGSSKVDGLASCLRDRDYRIARELMGLEISPTRMGQAHVQICYDDEYVASLTAHNGEVLPVVKTKMSKSSKCAVISVVSGRGGRLQAVQYLDSSLLRIIFAFAATPESRSVQAAQYPSRDDTFELFILM